MYLGWIYRSPKLPIFQPTSSSSCSTSSTSPSSPSSIFPPLHPPHPTTADFSAQRLPPYFPRSILASPRIAAPAPRQRLQGLRTPQGPCLRFAIAHRTAPTCTCRRGAASCDTERHRGPEWSAAAAGDSLESPFGDLYLGPPSAFSYQNRGSRSSNALNAIN